MEEDFIRYRTERPADGERHVDGVLSWVHPFDLKEAEDNPRRISDERLEALKYSLEHDPGMMIPRPVIVDAQRGDAVAGNMRVRVSKLMIGDDEYPNFNAFVREHKGIPTYVAELDEKRRREWMLRDNAGYGEYVAEELSAIVKAHAEAEGDMELLGFTEEDLSAIIAAADAGQGGAGAGAGGEPVPEQWGIVIECETEAQQAELLEELHDREGLTCRALL